MKFESEVLTDDLLPAIRSVISSKLSEDYGLNQYEIAELLEVTQPAVSQYLGGKRANQELLNQLKDDHQTSILLNDAADKVAKEKDCTQEIRQIVSTVRDKGFLREKFSNADRVL